MWTVLEWVGGPWDEAAHELELPWHQDPARVRGSVAGLGFGSDEFGEFGEFGRPSLGRKRIWMWVEAFNDQSDEALFARVALGDAEAFAAFYDRHETLWYSIALRILHSEAEAEDVVQEAAVLIWERAPLYKSEFGRPISWTVTVLRNKAIDRLRSSRRRGEVLERAAQEFGGQESSGGLGGPGVSGESAGLVRKTLLHLPVEQRQAIELAFFGGLSQSEVAEKLNEPLGTIKARIRRGMLAMRDALEGAL
ncbi:MAG: sigma-70 family RNA polymerase sigma factor [Limisphaerales bacterium]